VSAGRCLRVTAYRGCRDEPVRTRRSHPSCPSRRTICAFPGRIGWCTRGRPPGSARLPGHHWCTCRDASCAQLSSMPATPTRMECVWGGEGVLRSGVELHPHPLYARTIRVLRHTEHGVEGRHSRAKAGRHRPLAGRPSLSSPPRDRRAPEVVFSLFTGRRIAAPYVWYRHTIIPSYHAIVYNTVRVMCRSSSARKRVLGGLWV